MFVRTLSISILIGLGGFFGSGIATALATPPGAISQITACDRMTAAEYDENAIAPPVTWAILARTAGAAITACRDALAADADNPRLVYQLARALDADRRYRDAAELYLKISDSYTAAKSELASLYATGQGVPQQQEKAFTIAKEAADDGNQHALALVGRFHALGIGTPKDPDLAFATLSSGAAGGYGPAMEGLGDLYLNGIGVEKSLESAVGWYEMAADKGRIRAATGVANWYRSQPQGIDQAVYWYALAARAGNADSMNALGTLFMLGNGVEKSEEMALEWYTQAAGLGHGQAMHNIGDIFASSRDFKEAQKWYEEATAAGYSQAAFVLALGHDRAIFGPDYQLAVEYLIFAALSGLEEARTALVSGLAKGWSEEMRRALQRRLAEEGLYDGPIDGEIGPGSRQAILQMLSN